MDKSSELACLARKFGAVEKGGIYLEHKKVEKNISVGMEILLLVQCTHCYSTSVADMTEARRLYRHTDMHAI